MTKFSYSQFFYETRLYRGNAIVKMLYSSSKKIIRDSRMLVDKKASDFVLQHLYSVFFQHMVWYGHTSETGLMQRRRKI